MGIRMRTMRICDATLRRLLPAASNRQEGTVGGFASVFRRVQDE